MTQCFRYSDSFILSTRLRRTSLSFDWGARTTGNTGVLVFHDCFSPRKILYRSADDILSTGFKGFTTTAMTTGACCWLWPNNRMEAGRDTTAMRIASPIRCRFMTPFPASEPKRQLELHIVDGLQSPPEGSIILRFEGYVIVEIVTYSRARAMAKIDIFKYGRSRTGIHVLVSEVGSPLFPEFFRNKRVKRRSIKSGPGFLHLVLDKEAFIQKFKSRGNVDQMSICNRLPNVERPLVGMNAVVIERTSHLQPVDPIGAHEEPHGGRVSIVLVDIRCGGIADVGANRIGSAVFEDIVQPQCAGGNLARYRSAHSLRWNRPAVVGELHNQWTIGGRLQPLPMVEG